MKGRGPRRLTPPNNGSLLHLLKLSLCSCILLLVQAARRGGDGQATGLNMVANIMLDRAGRKAKANNFQELCHNLLVLDGNLGKQSRNEEDDIRGGLTFTGTRR